MTEADSDTLVYKTEVSNDNTQDRQALHKGLLSTDNTERTQTNNNDNVELETDDRTPGRVISLI